MLAIVFYSNVMLHIFLSDVRVWNICGPPHIGVSRHNILHFMIHIGFSRLKNGTACGGGGERSFFQYVNKITRSTSIVQIWSNAFIWKSVDIAQHKQKSPTNLFGMWWKESWNLMTTHDDMQQSPVVEINGVYFVGLIFCRPIRWFVSISQLAKAVAGAGRLFFPHLFALLCKREYRYQDMNETWT